MRSDAGMSRRSPTQGFGNDRVPQRGEVADAADEARLFESLATQDKHDDIFYFIRNVRFLERNGVNEPYPSSN